MVRPIAKLVAVLKRKQVWAPALVIIGLLLVAIVYLRWQGRVWWCEQGDWLPMSIAQWASRNETFSAADHWSA